MVDDTIEGSVTSNGIFLRCLRVSGKDDGKITFAGEVLGVRGSELECEEVEGGGVWECGGSGGGGGGRGKHAWRNDPKEWKWVIKHRAWHNSLMDQLSSPLVKSWYKNNNNNY